MYRITILLAAMLPLITINAQNMENALTPRRQHLAVIAALEAKGDQTGLEKAAADSWMQHLTYHKDVQAGASNEWLEPVSDRQYRSVQQ